MLTLLLVLLLGVVPVALYFARQYKTQTPSLQWPALAPILNMEYAPNPPRLSGQWNGRPVLVEALAQGVRVSSSLPKPSRLRIEIGPRELVTRRSGVIVPDPVQTGDSAFEERFLARCSDKDAGLKIVDPVLRQRLLAFPFVDILGEGRAVQWLIPDAKDPDTLEFVFDILTVIAVEMERFPSAPTG